MRNHVTVVVVDDQEIVRKGICALLESTNQIHLIGEAANGKDALVIINALHPDVVLLDIMMPEMDGFDTLKSLREKDTSTRVLILSMYSEEAYALKAHALGANGYILKNAGVNMLMEGIERIMAGDEFFPELRVELDHIKPPMTSESFEKMKIIWSTLTDRERQIVEMASEGLMNKEIADKLGISVRTVEVHVYNFMKKLGLRNRTELIKFTLDNRLIFTLNKKPPH